MSDKTEWECSICQRMCTGIGNNAEPVNSGRCCDECNTNVVVPMRLMRVLRRPYQEGN